MGGYRLMNSLRKLKENYVPIELDPKTAQETAWFREMKFGMFMHPEEWGVLTL
jgi:hypothetical protein